MCMEIIDLQLIKENKEQMRNYSQQNDIMEQQNSKIADIYQKMLMGDKSALSNLQSVKIINKNNLEQLQNKTIQSPIKKKSQNNLNNNQNNNNKQTTKQSKISPFKRTPNRIQTIQQQLFQQSIQPSTYDNFNKYQQTQNYPQQSQNFSSFIKNKVNQLRIQKQLIKSQQQNQINQIKNITKNIKLNISNQSKSYDLVKRKQFLPNQSVDNSRGSPVRKKEQKKRFQSLNVKQNLKKTQSSVQYGTNKHLPPLNQKKKVPTQHSQHDSQLNNSNYRQRSKVGTPISLANSKYQISPKTTQKDQKNYRNEQVSIKNIKQKEKEKQRLIIKDKRKVRQSRSIRIPLPELKKQKQEFAFINEKQKNFQLDLIKYHQNTKEIIDKVRNKYSLNLKNNEKMVEIKRTLNPQPILVENKTKKRIEENLSLQNENSGNKKKNFEIFQQKIRENRNDIDLIEEMIIKKKMQIQRGKQKLNRNMLLQYWSVHDLYTSDFEVSQQEQQENKKSGQQFDENHSTRSSNIKQAYSTSMPHTKEKGWKSKAIKQYDTNRSFQEYAKSRSLMKGSKVREQINRSGLNRIEEKEDQSRQQQDRESYKVTVDSRLRRLLIE